ncbi:hypothetical protein ES703_93533 [subsurface metagenome]
MYLEPEFRPEDGFAEQAELFRFGDSQGHVFHSKRIFHPNINVAFRGADRIGPDDHAFNDTVRVAFQKASIHVSSWVSLVCIADDILYIRVDFVTDFPFFPGQETCPPSSS